MSVFQEERVGVGPVKYKIDMDMLILFDFFVQLLVTSKSGWGSTFQWTLAATASPAARNSCSGTMGLILRTITTLLLPLLDLKTVILLDHLALWYSVQVGT